MNQAASVWFDRYEQIQELGAGGMARVLLARDLLLERRVALKLLRSPEPELSQRLLFEARVTARCRHDNIVVIYEVGQHNAIPYIVLEYLCGKPLTALIESAGRLPYARAVEILVPVLGALQHIHDAGIVHRDLKPDNIFMTESGIPKLLDFGIAKLLRPRAPGWGPADHARDPQDPLDWATGSAQLTRAGMIVGTYQYMSPEQWGISDVDHLTDIWACGILLHWMICGRHPLPHLEGNQLVVTAMLDSPMPSMAEVAPPEVPRALIGVVDRCLRKLKDQRWQSAAALLAALRPFMPGGDSEGKISWPYDAPTRIAAAPPPAMLASWAPVAAPHPPAAAAMPHSGKSTILFLAADPTGVDEFTLGRQARAIQEELERAGWRDRFELVTRWAPTPLDLLRELRKIKPIVVQFAGSGQAAAGHRHGQRLVGDRVGGLFFQGIDGRPQFVSATALQEMFDAAGASVRLVVLNGCFSELQAQALLLHVDCVVGTRGTVDPAAAKAYAIGFFGGLGEHESVATAHKQGCAAISLMGLGDDDRPQLMVRRGIDAAKLFPAAARAPGAPR
ncbi:MAG TPA: serine/threonine-protein kinase [Kofleriaceae bacterium]